MPSRILRDGINDSRRINALSEGSELFYRRLMSLVDDFGRYEADIVLLHAKLYALRRSTTEENVKSFLEECSAGDNPLISLYWSGRKQYLQINDFGQRERTSKFPAPPSFVGSLPQNAAECGNLPQNAAYARASNTNTTTTPNTNSSERESEGKPATEAEMDEFSVWASGIHLAHPNSSDKYQSLLTLKNRFSQDAEARESFARNHELWTKSEKWRDKQGAFVPRLWKWIEDDGWKKAPPTPIRKQESLIERMAREAREEETANGTR